MASNDSSITNMATKLPATMRAIQWRTAAGGLEKNLIYTTNAPLPKSAQSLPKDSVLVKVNYASINPVEFKIAEGPIGWFLSKPATPGLDYSGVVVRSNLKHIQPGNKVFGSSALPNFGSLAEYNVVSKAGVAMAPEGVKLEDLGAIGVTGLTAYQSIAPFVKQGDSVLVNGASGGVGTWTVQFAKALGCNVTAVCSGANVQLIKNLGADEVIDYKAANLIDTLKKSGKQYDLIIDNAFKDPALYYESHHFLKAGHKFVTMAGEATLAFTRTFLSILLLPSWLGGGKRPFQFIANAANAPEYEKIAAWIKEGKVKPVVDQTLDLEQSAKGYERLKTGRTVGNILIKVSE